jgi:serine protease DegS/serine protease DegQ
MMVDGKQAKDPDSMRNLIVALIPGKQATLKLKRGQNDLEVQVKVGKRPEAKRATE